MKKPCIQCGVEIEKPSQYSFKQFAERKFCSKECRLKSPSSTRFKKGMNPWNKGKTHSAETRKKLSKALKGKDRGGILTRTCAVCNASFQIQRHRLKSGGGNYCSISCSLRNKPSWNKGKKWSEEVKKKFSLAKLGEKSWNWKGGRGKSGNYISVKKPGHPFCSSVGRVSEHRLVAEKALGRFLEPHEVIHHINNKGTDNRLENLYLFESACEHSRYHRNFKFGNCEEIIHSNLI